MTHENGVACAWSVHFEDEAEGYSFYPGEIRGTGKISDRSEFYDDDDPESHIRVRVVDGYGETIEDD